jgi:murein L,D-transpeptidase YcbB/YkuD
MGSGNVLTLSMTANQSISTPTITVAGTALTVVGSGNGPYAATYTLSNNKAALPVAISFNNAAGTGGQAKFTIGDAGAISSDSSSANTSPSSSTDSSTANPTSITSYLKVGSTGPEVKLLQNRLKSLGVYSGSITGTFGAQTQAAVKKLQAKYKLSQLGVVGPATRAVLNSR